MFAYAEALALLMLILGACAAYWDWPGGAAVRRAGSWLWEWARANPAAAILWILVLMHGLMLAGLPHDVQDQVLRTRSTNLDQMRDDPVAVLVGSALWTELSDLPFATAMAFFVWGPAERWLGTPRAVAAFFIGHVGASLLLAGRAAHLVGSGVLGSEFTTIVDVGVSLGSLCLAGLLVYRLPFAWRLPVIGALLLVIRSSFFLYGRYSTAGHTIALLIGLLLWPLTRAASVRARAGTPWIEPVRPAPETVVPAPPRS
ncbi:hypothetical protein J4573_51705 [Actinomadura barringtoniae]|uniref:Transmembrane protein n=1 Tax=Actinomadura barringtoniae TaxID=1427535 RepID=A0A939PME4_9ACTN|nr:rhomboid-like protein [Actinomadura barringtoniae]MBO2455622.1 hypothetical protein [Actinomadura barringtoniae]